MVEKIDYQKINAILETLAPLIRIDNSEDACKEFAYYLLIIASTISAELGISQAHFIALAESAGNLGKKKMEN